MDNYRKVISDVESSRKASKTTVFETARTHFENERSNLKKWVQDRMNSIDYEERDILNKLKEIYDGMSKEESKYLHAISNDLWKVQNLYDYIIYLITDAKYHEITKETCEKLTNEISFIENPIPLQNRKVQLIPVPLETTNFTIIKLTTDKLDKELYELSNDKQKSSTSRDLEKRLLHQRNDSKSSSSNLESIENSFKKFSIMEKQTENVEITIPSFSNQILKEQPPRMSDMLLIPKEVGNHQMESVLSAKDLRLY
ncbi:unnamed protein product [Dimorphilus gyrociliatus]|uniref:Uncharacterized protein n=1 Tax=Dimorphilus gyrociliatus TaxID=2664684 RepID=A0A7I8V6B0_9ANNE|nr:unnamed protein product [Dimorphilus gyrociliatus]